MKQDCALDNINLCILSVCYQSVTILFICWPVSQSQVSISIPGKNICISLSSLAPFFILHQNSRISQVSHDTLYAAVAGLQAAGVQAYLQTLHCDGAVSAVPATRLMNLSSSWPTHLETKRRRKRLFHQLDIYWPTPQIHLLWSLDFDPDF